MTVCLVGLQIAAMPVARVGRHQCFETMSVGARQIHSLLAVPHRLHVGLQAWPMPRGVGTKHIHDELSIAYVPVGTVLDGVEELVEGKNLTIRGMRGSAGLLAAAEYVTVDLLAQRHEVFALKLNYKLYRGQ